MDDKDLVKQAIKEWMNERFAEFGWWTFKTIGVAALTFFLYKYIEFRGFKFP